MNYHSSTTKKYYFPLIGAFLAAASLFHFSLPAFAVGTNAGIKLKNRATATYENVDGSEFGVISNEVTVTVGKVAGITNVPDGFVDNTNNGSVLPGDSVGFDFKISNTGNDITNIFIPSAATINGNARNVTIPDTATAIQYSIDGGTTFLNRPANGIIPDVGLNKSIIVRVTGTVNSSINQGDTISVRLGDTGNNTADTNSTDFPGTQNQLDIDPTVVNDPQEQDVRTITSSTAIVSGEPVNKQREASATNVITVGSNPIALTRIRKTNDGFTNGASASSLNDNVISYKLELDVLNQKPAGYNNFAFAPANLEGRQYNIPGIGKFNGITDQTNLILISDAIPDKTILDKATANANVTTPNSNWTRVYTDDPLTTAPEKAEWETVATAPGLTNPITRVGWVYDASAANAKITKGTTQAGFGFKVVTNGLSNTATSIYNIAQVFGSTDDGVPATATGRITFDESGDENPNNFNDDGTGGPDETIADGGNFGKANPGTSEDNVDIDNNNTATGSIGGEVNKVRVTLAPAASTLFNGPKNIADAIGGIFNTDPADDNHDFQNLGVSTPTVDANNTQDLTTYNPAPVKFTNTVKNPGTTQINNVILQPISPEDLSLGGSATNLVGNGTNLATSVVVKVTYGAQIATYIYDSATKTFVYSGSPVIVPSIGGGNSISYDVEIDLPLGTKLSTADLTTGTGNVGGYAIPIAAYTDNNNIGTGLKPSTTYSGNGLTIADKYNVTVNQVYTGYLKLVKKARVLRANTAGQYSLVPGMNFNDPDTTKQPAPGDRLEYQVTYSNISEPQSTGGNSVLLEARDVKITEDGTVGANNWGIDSIAPNEDGDTIIDTLHVPSSAQDSNSGTISYFKGKPSNTASSSTDKVVTRYVDRVTNVAPGVDGTFTFQRKVTDESDIKELTTP